MSSAGGVRGAELLDVMRELKNREGIPMAVQVDKALRDWLDRRGLKVKIEHPFIGFDR
jgi:hypothetical protein